MPCTSGAADCVRLGHSKNGNKGQTSAAVSLVFVPFFSDPSFLYVAVFVQRRASLQRRYCTPFSHSSPGMALPPPSPLAPPAMGFGTTDCFFQPFFFSKKGIRWSGAVYKLRYALPACRNKCWGVAGTRFTRWEGQTSRFFTHFFSKNGSFLQTNF